MGRMFKAIKGLVGKTFWVEGEVVHYRVAYYNGGPVGVRGRAQGACETCKRKPVTLYGYDKRDERFCGERCWESWRAYYEG